MAPVVKISFHLCWEKYSNLASLDPGVPVTISKSQLYLGNMIFLHVAIKLTIEANHFRRVYHFQSQQPCCEVAAEICSHSVGSSAGTGSKKSSPASVVVVMTVDSSVFSSSFSNEVIVSMPSSSSSSLPNCKCKENKVAASGVE